LKGTDIRGKGPLTLPEFGDQYGRSLAGFGVRTLKVRNRKYRGRSRIKPAIVYDTVKNNSACALAGTDFVGRALKKAKFPYEANKWNKFP
jgi:hypothetical protein